MTNTIEKNRVGLNSNQLRILAVCLMLLDHLWGAVINGQAWMTCVGRMAFPIFAFLIAEGYAHTHDWKAYAKRLFWFALISEVPFDYMMESTPLFPFHQNVMFTLLLGLLAIHCWELASAAEKTAARLGWSMLCLLCVLMGAVGMTDYGSMGVVTVLLFWVSRTLPYRWIFQLVGMVILNVVTVEGFTFLVEIGPWKYDFPQQGFAVLALIFIWLYNGKKGRTSKPLQYAVYAFYPAHMLVLYLIRTLR